MSDTMHVGGGLYADIETSPYVAAAPAQEAKRARAKASAKAIEPAPKGNAKAAKKNAPKAAKAAKKAAPAKKAAKGKAKAPKLIKEPKAPRADGKGATILALVARRNGATLEELMEATGWQKHSIRGFISTANKKGHAIESVKNEGQRSYVALQGK